MVKHKRLLQVSDSENISLKNLVNQQREEHIMMEVQLEWVKAERNYLQETENCQFHQLQSRQHNNREQQDKYFSFYIHFLLA